jgi:anti-sigma regulatory factor (Ser/Thr protein kinase)
MNHLRQPSSSTSLRLAAVPTAVPCSRMFARAALQKWSLRDYIDVTELVMSELVTNAVKATGITGCEPKSWEILPEHVIGVQLRITGTSLFVEVWDRSPDSPHARNPDDNEEGGRGLLLIGAICKRWDVYLPGVGGKVVWAELELSKAPEQSRRGHVSMPIRVPGNAKPPPGPVRTMAHMGLLQRVLDCLRSPDEPRAGLKG